MHGPLLTYWRSTVRALLLSVALPAAVLAQQDLTTLTVPLTELPAGCELRPVAHDEQVAFLPIDSNPTVTRDNRVRGILGGMLEPPDSAEQQQGRDWIMQQRAAAIDQAYAAFYRSAESPEIGVWAVHYRTSISADRAERLLHPLLPGTPVLGDSTAALVWTNGPEDPCFSQVLEHVQRVVKAGGR